MKTLLPLGVDLGTTRVRVALAERLPVKGLRLRAVVSRDLDDVDHDTQDEDLLAAIVEDLVGELEVTRRTCVTAIGVPYARLEALRFPRMTRSERRNAARFELEGETKENERVRIRIHPVDRATQLFAVGAVDESALKHRIAVLRRAGLRVVGVDHDACSLGRLLPDYDTLVDVGSDRMRVHLFSESVPVTRTVESAGSDVTQAIAAELAIDTRSAERRKRILGVAGAGEAARDALIRALCAVIEQVRGRGTRIARLGLLGNGARLPGFAEGIAERLRVPVELPIADLLRTADVSSEVLRTASPDWTLAAALSTWSSTV